MIDAYTQFTAVQRNAGVTCVLATGRLMVSVILLDQHTEPRLNDLADYIRTIRKQRGYSLSELACRSGLSKSELSSIENRRIKVPGVEKRRSLARALGVSHMDILIAAGELDPAEIPIEGRPVEPFVPGDPRRALYNRMLDVHWTDTRLISIIDQLDRMLELDRGHTPQVLLAKMIEED